MKPDFMSKISDDHLDTIIEKLSLTIENTQKRVNDIGEFEYIEKEVNDDVTLIMNSKLYAQEIIDELKNELSQFMSERDRRQLVTRKIISREEYMRFLEYGIEFYRQNGKGSKTIGLLFLETFWSKLRLDVPDFELVNEQDENEAIQMIRKKYIILGE